MSDANTAINTVSVDCPAKTNLTLHVGRPRSEWGGRHELDTIYCAVGVYDTVTTSRKKPGSGFSLNLEGAYLGDLASSGSDMRRNHAVLALFAMAEASGHEPDVALNIEKRIPVGAGMAGGSADAAATILALNTLWNLDWSIERLQQVAATLGADMPFCLTGGYARGTGFGEQIEQLSENSDAVLELTDQGFAGRLLVGAYQAELRTPEVYAYPLEPRVGEDFPYARIGFPQGYRWRGGRVEVPIYAWEGRAIWGLTGRITRRLLEGMP